MTKLVSALPKGNNGLDAINDEMCEEPDRQHYEHPDLREAT